MLAEDSETGGTNMLEQTDGSDPIQGLETADDGFAKPPVGHLQ
jgi:hypothetical protein